MFESESLGRLMLKFSLPAIISMVVNSIYNIVDQIFIGWGVNHMGIAATNVTFPLVTTSMAASTVVVICMNRLLVKYGGKSIYGADIPPAAFGIVMKVNSIIVSVMVGLGIGSQPIVGYNYGAKKFDRVKTVYLRTIAVGSLVAVAGWLCFQLRPQVIVSAFGQESALYNQFAVKCFREFLSVCFHTPKIE